MSPTIPGPIRPKLIAMLLVLGAGVLAAGCGDDDGGSSGGGIEVVATTTQAADLVRNVGGARVDVRQMLSPNTDPHDYEPRPSDVKALADAALVVRSGGDLDDWLGELIDNAGSDAPVVTLIDLVETIEGSEEEDEDVDPHWWQDPRNAELAVAAIRKALVEADSDGRREYESNARAYLARLSRLDRSVRACVDEVPPEQRKLVTTHDALGYYARRYGIEVIGALIPSLSTQAQASAGDTAKLVSQIEDEGVKAIFPESSINPKLERAVSRETGAEVGEALWADTLGPEGSTGSTYVDSIAFNTEAIVDGLSGGRVSCRPRA